MRHSHLQPDGTPSVMPLMAWIASQPAGQVRRPLFVPMLHSSGARPRGLLGAHLPPSARDVSPDQDVDTSCEPACDHSPVQQDFGLCLAP